MLNRRKFAVSISLVSVCWALPFFGQESRGEKVFAGTWEAKFKGTVFCVLKLEAGAKISGTLSPGKISLNDDGDITEAEPSDPGQDFPILNPKVEDGRLSFEWKEGEADDESLKYVMTLHGEGEADLQIIAGDHAIKPLQLKRK